jgi:hypothetical protein
LEFAAEEVTFLPNFVEQYWAMYGAALYSQVTKHFIGKVNSTTVTEAVRRPGIESL